MMSSSATPERVARVVARAACSLLVAASFAWFCSASPASTAHAQEPPFGARARANAPTDEARAADPTATSSVVTVDPDAGAQATLDALVLEMPGARARRTGAYGAPSLLSIRGAEPRHNVVLLGDVPLDGVDDGGLDLSTIPASTLERVEVWRGGAPLWWSAGTIGGVVRLVPREPRETGGAVTLGLGSFGLYSVQASVSAAPRGERGLRTLAVAGVTQSAGDFPYADDRGTLLDPTGAVTRHRSNGQLTQSFGLLRLRGPLLGGELDTVALGLGREGGVPGHALRPTRETRRTLARAVLASAWTRSFADDDGERVGRVQLALSASHERSRFTDLFGELGIPSAADDSLTRAGLRLAAERALTSWLGVTGVASYRLESLAPDDALARLANRPSIRHTGALGVEAPLRFEAGGVAVDVRPSARLELAQASLSSLRIEDGPVPVSKSYAVPTARLGASVAPVRWLALTGAVAYGARLPTMLELFGDRGWLLPSVDLRPEHGLGAELGARVRAQHRELRVRAEVHAFVREDRDFIRYVRTSQFQAVAQNIDSAGTRGLELALDARLARYVSLVSALTLLDAVDTTRDRALPLRPATQLYTRLSGRVPRFGLIESIEPYFDVAYVARSAADPANTTIIPARTVLGCGVAVSLRARRATAAFSVSDLADVRGQDLLGFPLPGRTFLMTLTLRAE
jgi:iron complex outermembrane receptor protein